MTIDVYADAPIVETRGPSGGFGVLFVGLVFVAFALCWSIALLNDVELPGRPLGRRTRRGAR